VPGLVLRATHRYRHRCREQSGAFGGAQGRVPRDACRLVAGEESMSVFEPENGFAETYPDAEAGRSPAPGSPAAPPLW